jgi:hypothetical protein
LWKVFPKPSAGSGPAELTNDERAKLWNTLADADAAAAFQAMCQLLARPAEAVSVLEAAWKRQPRATAKQMHKWLEDLYSDDDAIRATAQKELQRFASGHKDLLRQALKETGALAVRQRLEKILDGPDAEYLRRTRMVEILEQLHTPAARQFLQALAEQKER